MLDVFVLVRETPVNTPCTDPVHSCPKKGRSLSNKKKKYKMPATQPITKL